MTVPEARPNSLGLTVEVVLDAPHPRANVVSLNEWQAWLRVWLTALSVELSPLDAYEIGLQLTDDNTIRQLNRQYRGQDRSTDVLAFASLEDPMPPGAAWLNQEPLYLGDIIISLDTAERQAKEQAHSLRQETVWLAAHGFLHLLGWDHPNDESLIKMLTQQRELLAKVGICLENLG